MSNLSISKKWSQITQSPLLLSLYSKAEICPFWIFDLSGPQVAVCQPHQAFGLNNNLLHWAQMAKITC